MPMATRLSRVGIHNQGFPSIKLNSPLITCSYKVHQILDQLYLYTTRPIATKLCKVLTYYEKFLPIDSNKPLDRWSPEVT